MTYTERCRYWRDKMHSAGWRPLHHPLEQSEYASQYRTELCYLLRGAFPVPPPSGDVIYRASGGEGIYALVMEWGQRIR